MPIKVSRPARVATVLATAVALTITACSSNNNGGAGTPGGGGGGPHKITLTVGTFGTFDMDTAGLYAEYHRLHPNITIKQDNVELSADYWTRLQTRLASGTGLDDVQAIEIGFVADVLKNHANQFVNFNALPETSRIKSTFYPWKWGMATTPDGKTVGLGTDIGPEAIAYRVDLYKQAGLPYKPAQVAAKMKTWQDFINLGKQYEASPTKPKGSSFVDSAASIFSTAVYQGKEAYAKPDGTPDVANSDGVKNAWKLATTAAKDHITAGLQQFTNPWNHAFSNGAFATIAAPTWMMGYIEGQAGNAYKGKWDIAPVLPGGATNWGGSWLGVPVNAAHRDAAIKFVEWVTAPAQQEKLWTVKGHFPSSKTAAESPAVQTAKSAYFSNAPVGKIFSAIAAKMKIPPISLYDTQIQNIINTQLTNVETRGTAPDTAFGAALNQIKQVTG